MMSPLPMRQLNTAAVNEKSGTKRVAPTPVVTGELLTIMVVHQLACIASTNQAFGCVGADSSRPDSSQTVKKARRIAPEAL